MKKTLLLALVAIIGLVANAQGRSALKINEVMVSNNSSIVDEYGDHNAWIELFNSAYGPLEISSVYLTTDPNQPKMYPVPLGDVNTKIPKRQHVIFWADNQPDKGTFHTTLQLVPGQDNWIGIYDANGITLIDEVVVPASLTDDQTWARKTDGKTIVDANGNDISWEVRDNGAKADGTPSYITPSSNNIIKDGNHKVQYFHERDKNGFALTVMAMCIVFSALLVLCICFMIISKIFAKVVLSRKLRAHGLDPIADTDAAEHDSGEEIAAIAMALAEHLDAHDTESTVLTINKVKRAYSPWSSKIYSLRELPRR
ncbi:MAG: OadG family protein [Muribaculaceae bacterium]|nr:OadG family protein [Muribaculaceae bacterium]